MSQKILITGGSGFAGSHLVELLLQDTTNDVHITNATPRESYVHQLLPNDHIHTVDLTNYDETANLIKQLQPHFIYHLAAISVVGNSFEQARTIIQNNLSLQLSLFDAVKMNSSHSRILAVGSAMEYDVLGVPSDQPIPETHALGSASPYGVSKIAQDLLGLSYFYSYKLDVVRVRPFNHIGERQTTDFAVPNFAEQLIQIEKGEKPAQLQVGNLEATRDFTDVKDVVKAYQVVMDQGKAGEVYNVGSGKGHKLSEILSQMISLIGQEVEIIPDLSRYRPLDVPVVLADTNKIAALGWRSEIPIEQTLKRILMYWRNQ